jgi:hypothetical protein
MIKFDQWPRNLPWILNALLDRTLTFVDGWPDPRLSGARRLTVCSDVGFPDSMRPEGVSEIDGVIASRWSPPVRR